LTALSDVTGRDVDGLVGGGAAGALSAGLHALLGAEMVSGAEMILEAIGFDDALQGASLVVTGEGRMDSQTISGKGPFGVALRAKEHGVPTVAIVGSLGVDDQVLHDAGLMASLPILDKAIPLEIAMRDAAELVERTALRLGYLLQMNGGLSNAG
jgi:glycerate kinase